MGYTPPQMYRGKTNQQREAPQKRSIFDRGQRQQEPENTRQQFATQVPVKCIVSNCKEEGIYPVLEKEKEGKISKRYMCEDCYQALKLFSCEFLLPT